MLNCMEIDVSLFCNSYERLFPNKIKIHDNSSLNIKLKLGEKMEQKEMVEVKKNSFNGEVLKPKTRKIYPKKKERR